MRMQKITLNLVPEGDKPIVYASQFDNDRVIRFDLKDGEEDYSYSGTETFEVAIRKPDDHLVTLAADKDSEIITVDDEPVTVYFVKVSLDENSCACFGESICELKITDGETLIGSLNFVLDVERSPELNGITSTDGIHDLREQIEDITSEVVGENYYDKEEIDNKFDDLDIPTKTSELENDSGFITAEDVPTKTSELENDSGFITIDDAATVNDKTWSSEKINEELINILPIGTASGPVANFNTSVALPYESVVCDVNATGGGGTPTTPIPIVGVSNVNVTQADENMQAVDTQIINLGGTYYGGHFTQDKDGHRRFEVTSQNYTFGGSEQWSWVENGSYWRFNLGQSVSAKYHACLCEVAKCEIVNLRYLIVRTGENPSITSESNMNNIFSNGVKLVYELTTPYTIDLPDGAPITALVGINNVYCDTGDTTVQYKCTINEYVNSIVGNNRSLSMMRTLETLENEDIRTEDLRKGDQNEDT